MCTTLIPGRWQTARLILADSTPAEAPELQAINDIVPQTRSWMQVEGQDNPDCSMLLALTEGVLPPIPGRAKDHFRLQSIRLVGTGELIGFLGVYHGFPDEHTFWLNVITFHPNFQGKGYGPELLLRLGEIVRQLGGYSRMRTYVELTNWPSLRMCIKGGLDRMVEIVGDRIHAQDAEAHVLLEKTLAPA
jgi:diamine N-acetyltransferase